MERIHEVAGHLILVGVLGHLDHSLLVQSPALNDFEQMRFVRLVNRERRLLVEDMGIMVETPLRAEEEIARPSPRLETRSFYHSSHHF